MSDEIKEEPVIEKDKGPVVTAAEKEAFFKAMLSDKPYTQVTKLFDGKLSVKFKTLTMEENNDILSQITLDQNKGIAKNEDSYLSRIAQYRLGVSIESIDNLPFQKELTALTVPFNQETGESYVTERIKLFAAWQVPKLAGVLGAFSSFEQKVFRMTNKMEDPSFWKAGV